MLKSLTELWLWIVESYHSILSDMTHILSSFCERCFGDWLTLHACSKLAAGLSTALVFIAFLFAIAWIGRGFSHILTWLLDLVFIKSFQSAGWLIQTTLSRIMKSIFWLIGSFFRSIKRIFIN